MNSYKKTLFPLLIVSFLLLSLSGCGDSKESSPEHGNDSDEHQHSSDMTEADMHHMTPDSDAHSMDAHSAESNMKKPADARQMTIVATDFAFDPANIIAKSGEKLFIELVNQGNVVHMWQLEGKPETHVHALAGVTSAKVVIAPEKAGTYQLVCGTPGHVQLGMVGTLKVE